MWVATFADVTKYIRERKSTEIKSKMSGRSIKVNISSSLDPFVYDVPITLKTYVPKNWESVSINNGQIHLKAKTDTIGNYVIYTISPKDKEIILQERL